MITVSLAPIYVLSVLSWFGLFLPVWFAVGFYTIYIMAHGLKKIKATVYSSYLASTFAVMVFYGIHALLVTLFTTVAYAVMLLSL